MIREEEIQEVGVIQRTHALKGELNMMLDVDPEALTPDTPLILRIEGILVPFYAESVRPKGATTLLVKLRGVDSQEEAQKLVNSPVYMLDSDLPEDEPVDGEGAYEADLIGYTIVDSSLGEVGEIVGIDDRTLNHLFIVERPGGDEVFIPVAEEFLTGINPETRQLFTSLPEGMDIT